MKTSQATLAAVVALMSGSALAADLPVLKAPPVLPPPPLWTGFYFGANVGAIFDAGSGVTTTAFPLYNDAGAAALQPASFFGTASALAVPGSTSLSNVGVIGGGQVGYNWQFTNFVAGIEADIQGATLSSAANLSGAATESSTGSMVAGQSQLSKTLNYLGTVRGRVGYLVTPTLLIYGTGGLAYGGMVFTNGLFLSSANPNYPLSAVSANYSDAHIGWTAGGGVEWMFLANWSAKAEYLYYDLGSVSATNIAAAPVASGALLYAAYYQSSARFNGNIVRAGINYHFSWFTPAPVVAKY